MEAVESASKSERYDHMKLISDDVGDSGDSLAKSHFE